MKKTDKTFSPGIIRDQIEESINTKKLLLNPVFCKNSKDTSYNAYIMLSC